MRSYNYCTLLVLLIFITIPSLLSAGEDQSKKVIRFKGETFGGADYEEGNDIKQTSDGGYILIGTTNSFGAGGVDVYLVKVDKNGKEEWSKTFGGADYEEGNSVIETPDKGYLIAGSTKSFNEGNTDIYLIKTDKNGKEEWSKTFGDEKNEHGNVIEKTSDGGYIIFGTYLIKLDKDYKVEWERKPEVTMIIEGYSVKQTSDGGYILLGLAKVSGFGRKKLNLSKVDSKGMLESGWPKSLVMISGDHGSAIHKLPDNTYMIIGGSAALSMGKKDIFISKLDENGRKLWANKIGGDKYDKGNAFIQASDNGFVIAGLTQSKGAGEADVYLVKTTSVGKVLWERTYGGMSFERANSVIEASDGGYAVFGSTQSYGAGKSDMYLIKTDSEGNVN